MIRPRGEDWPALISAYLDRRSELFKMRTLAREAPARHLMASNRRRWMSGLDMEQRLARIEAIEEIRQLKHLYFAYCDDNYNPPGIAALFTEDGVWQGELFGNHVGRDAIRQHFERVSSDIVFAAHLGMNSIIEVDGDTATGKWRMIMPSVVMNGGAKEARWLLVAYEDVYAKVDGRWMFKSMSIHVNFYSPHLGDWADTAVP